MKLILDTPILLLFLVGSYDSDYIKNFKRTQKYTTQDYQKIKRIINQFEKVYITPQILAEISNLSFEIDSNRLGLYMKNLINQLRSYSEKYISMTILLEKYDLLSKIGFTDLATLEAANKQDFYILTDDFPLSQRARKLGYQALNFTQLRGYEWSLDPDWGS